MGDMTRMIGALCTTSRIGRTPRRFAITGSDIQPALHAAPRTPRAPAPLPPRQPELAEPPAAFAPKPAQPQDSRRKHPHLRLVVSND